ncbi:unnamed protein product [Spirodela intermedia]|uniref:Uncharacterized protein n=1 Tax=Spirodela intermedia TaxID=51605 RepID=A0A7I8IQA6_SPIIN|nr:unnamed protein product [Spirodela intermedia]CAA6660158.1 unnamed protein product [Spirodela intermedia]
MPLYKRTYFPPVKQPEGLDPDELVFQVRFTKEIFRDYQEYLNRLNFYRQRVWTCKATGKTNLTYEEALVSEHRASEKVQQIPKELAAPILQEVQYSTLKLKDLVNSVSAKLLERLFKGADLYAQKGKSVCACRILEILEDDDKIRYKVGWFGKDKEITSISVVDSEDLVRKKLPFSRSTLKSFIREATSRSGPWVIHENMAKKHVQKGQHRMHGGQKNSGKKRRKSEEELIRYPVDDLLVKPGTDDPVFTERPTPCREFCVPMDCVGDLLMVWDFCSSFCRLLRLWPFSLEDFEKAICHKDSDLVLVVESHTAILRLIIQNEGDFFEAVQQKRRKSKITQTNWIEFLCDFLEMVKLVIFRELVAESLITDAVREQLDEYIEQQRELGITKREELRRKREEQQPKAEESEAAVRLESVVQNGKGKLSLSEIGHIDSEMEKRFIRSNALGKDRNHNRYWFFRRDGRLFVESADFKQWGYYASKQERERALKRQLEKYYTRISSALQKRSKDIAQRILLEESVLRRSTRVRAQPRDSPGMAFLRYINKWKED